MRLGNWEVGEKDSVRKVFYYIEYKADIANFSFQPHFS